MRYCQLTVNVFFILHLLFKFQIIREFDRVNETPVTKIIQVTWQALVPIIIDLAKNESCAAIMTMIDGADDFPEGMFVYFRSNNCTSMSSLHVLSEYKSVVATCVLYLVIPDVRMKEDHTKIITIVEVCRC